MKRVFVALAVPADCAETLRARAHTLQVPAPFRVRWLDPAQYHITLVFVGELDESRLPLLESLAWQALAGLSAFNCTLAGIDLFPERSHPRWVAALVAPCQALEEMQRKLAMALAEAGFGRELRQYRPHITLARLHESGRLQARTGFCLAGEGLSFQVRAVTIFESRLGASGASYSELATIRLRAT